MTLSSALLSFSTLRHNAIPDGVNIKANESKIRTLGARWLQRSQGVTRLLYLALFLAILPFSVEAQQQVVNLTPSMSTAALQSAISLAPSGATVQFAAGIYTIASQMYIPCNGLQITGPVAATPTAILAASYTGSDIFNYPGGCASPGSIQYLHFENTGAVYFDPGNNSNFVFEHNLITNLPSMLDNGGSETGVLFDGTLNTTLTNVVIAYNTFGDDASCAEVFASVADEGGYCAGVVTSQGSTQNINILYNNFIHVEEGIHFNQLAIANPGGPNSVCIT